MKTILGDSPLTTIIGLLIAALTATQNLFDNGGHPTVVQIIAAAAIAIFGRFTAQSK